MQYELIDDGFGEGTLKCTDGADIKFIPLNMGNRDFRIYSEKVDNEEVVDVLPEGKLTEVKSREK